MANRRSWKSLLSRLASRQSPGETVRRPVKSRSLRVTGDCDGDDTIGLYDPVDSLFYLRNTNNARSADIYVSFGQGGAGLKPVAGDWNGDGIDTVGLYNPATGVFSLTNYPQGGDLTPFAFGAAGGIPIVGDWNRDGIDSIGVFQASRAQYSLRNSNTAGSADDQFGFRGHVPGAFACTRLPLRHAVPQFVLLPPVWSS